MTRARSKTWVHSGWTRVGADGAFAIANLPPGTYELTVEELRGDGGRATSEGVKTDGPAVSLQIQFE